MFGSKARIEALDGRLDMMETVLNELTAAVNSLLKLVWRLEANEKRSPAQEEIGKAAERSAEASPVGIRSSEGDETTG